jgi:hypothetical protein
MIEGGAGLSCLGYIVSSLCVKILTYVGWSMGLGRYVMRCQKL